MAPPEKPPHSQELILKKCCYLSVKTTPIPSCDSLPCKGPEEGHAIRRLDQVWLDAQQTYAKTQASLPSPAMSPLSVREAAKCDKLERLWIIEAVQGIAIYPFYIQEVVSLDSNIITQHNFVYTR